RGEPRIARVKEREVKMSKQLFSQGGGEKEPRRIGAEGNVGAKECARVWFKKIRNAAEDRPPVGNHVGQSAPCRSGEPRAVRHPRPEFLKPLESILAGIAGNQAGIYRANRCSDDPIWLNAAFMQRVIDAGLVGAECASALQNQDGLAILLGALFLRKRRYAL